MSASPRLLGIVGGLGPLASAELLGTIYRENLREREQEAPRCLLLSDPTFPDRTEALRRGDRTGLARRLGKAIESLVDQGAARVVVACFTIHAVLDDLTPALRERVVSLVDLTLEELEAETAAPSAPVPRLLLTTTGTHRAGVFQNHPRWSSVAERISILDEAEQDDLHELLYRLKRGADPTDELHHVRALEERHGARSSIFGCTELHLLQRSLRRGRGEGSDRPEPIDALYTVARRAAELAVGR